MSEIIEVSYDHEGERYTDFVSTDELDAASELHSYLVLHKQEHIRVCEENEVCDVCPRFEGANCSLIVSTPFSRSTTILHEWQNEAISIPELAKKYDVSERTITNIIDGVIT